MEKIKLAVIPDTKSGDTAVGTGFHTIDCGEKTLTTASRYQYEGWVDEDDKTLGRRVYSVDCGMVVRKSVIEGVGFHYSDKDETYALDIIWGNGGVQFTVESKSKALELVSLLKEWLLS